MTHERYKEIAVDFSGSLLQEIRKSRNNKKIVML